MRQKKHCATRAQVVNVCDDLYHEARKTCKQDEPTTRVDDLLTAQRELENTLFSQPDIRVLR